MSTNPNLPNTLQAIITKVRRITGRPSQTQLSDSDIIDYINTFYVYDMPEHIKMESLRYNYQLTTQPNIAVYDLPTDTYLTGMPPVYIGGYQSYMTQSRENFFRINPNLNFLQSNLYTGNGTNTGYIGQFLTQVPVMPGFKPNPPGAYATGVTSYIAPRFLNWNVMISGEGTANAQTGNIPSFNLVDDGQGNLFDITDADSNPTNARGTVNYATGAVNITNFTGVIPSGNPINAQYIPYVASRPQSVVFFQDQFILYPPPDQAYTVSFEAYKYPAAFLASQTTSTPQLNEWWQLLAYGAADKIFGDFGDFENLAKFRQLLKEQMDLVLRRTIVQQTSERTATIYTEQAGFLTQFPFGNNFSGF